MILIIVGIVDFRGPQGVWTLMDKGQRYMPTTHNEMPTIGHMAIKKLVDDNIVKYVVSQNTGIKFKLQNHIINLLQVWFCF